MVCMITVIMRAKGVLAMKKEYVAPLVEYLTFSVHENIADEGSTTISDPYNDGELGWS